MASEAELERLYQLFVTNGGGDFTFSNTNLTPKQYSELVSASQLTPIQMAELEARQLQYNKQSALNVFASEIDANNFSNPYVARTTNSNSLLSALTASAGMTNFNALAGAFSGISSADKALIFAGVLTATGVDLDGLLKVVGIATIGGAMFSSLLSHTNGQTANIPQTMADASSLASMNAQFGEQQSSCSFFNELMGIMGGVFDGTLDFIDSAISDITSLINQTGIPQVIDSMTSAISSVIGAAGGVIDDIISGISSALGPIMSGLTSALSGAIGSIGSIANKLTNAIGDISSQISNEIGNFANMAAELAAKALALTMAAAAMDPCQMAVILNTGSSNMKDAVGKITKSPSTNLTSEIPFTIDPRANAEEVVSTMATAVEKAAISPGVVQNPLTEAAKLYTPFDGYLHEAFGDASGSAFADVEEIVTDAGEVITSLKSATAPDTQSDNIEPTKTGKEVESEAQIQVLSKFYYDTRSTYSVYADWTSKQMEFIRDNRALTIQMQRALDKNNFTNKEDLKIRLTELISISKTNAETVKNLRKNYKNEFTYFTPGGTPSIVQEKKIKLIYESRIKPQMTRNYNNAVSSLANIQAEWSTIDKQLY